MDEAVSSDLKAARLNIGDAARLSDVSAKMIRHYESLGLLHAVARNSAGYRQYSMNDVHTLRFIRRARNLGFGMEEIGKLLSLWQNRKRASKEVKRIALEHAEALGERIAQMQAMQRTLAALAEHCHGDDRPDCPILEDLAQGPHASPAPAQTEHACPGALPRFE